MIAKLNYRICHHFTIICMPMRVHKHIYLHIHIHIHICIHCMYNTYTNKYYLLFFIGTKWQNRRKLAMSGFHFSLMKQFVEIMIAESNATTESLNHVDELIIEDLLLFTSNHTLNVICGI